MSVQQNQHGTCMHSSLWQRTKVSAHRKNTSIHMRQLACFPVIETPHRALLQRVSKALFRRCKRLLLKGGTNEPPKIRGDCEWHFWSKPLSMVALLWWHRCFHYSGCHCLTAAVAVICQWRKIIVPRQSTTVSQFFLWTLKNSLLACQKTTSQLSPFLWWGGGKSWALPTKHTPLLQVYSDSFFLPVLKLEV